MSDDLNSNRSADPQGALDSEALLRAFDALVAEGPSQAALSAAVSGEGTDCPEAGEWLRLTAR